MFPVLPVARLRLAARLAGRAGRLRRPWVGGCMLDALARMDARRRAELGLPPDSRPADRFYL